MHKHTHRSQNTQTKKQRNKETKKQRNKETNKQTNKQTNEKTNKQNDLHHRKALLARAMRLEHTNHTFMKNSFLF